MSTSTIARTQVASARMRRSSLQIAEYDRAGNLKATFVESPSVEGQSRVDVLVNFSVEDILKRSTNQPQQPTERKQIWRKTLDIFLPDGYPNSVTDDYTPYQIFDSFQAFAGTIAGMISSRAVWEGLGVGDSSASPTGAMLIQVIRECMGKLATIFFAHLMGTSIEAECKAYRLAADVLTDTAMILDCMSPWFPAQVRFLVLCVSSIMFSAAGVAGGASKSSLSGHFAKWNNLGELNAKDGSQETVISLMGMMTGTLVVSWLTTPFLTWTSLILLLILHLALNRIGVRAVKMRSLNRQRANIALSSLVSSNTPLTPAEVSAREVIFERRGGSVFRWNSGPVIGHCKYGASIHILLDSLADGKSHSKTRSMGLESVTLAELMHLFRDEPYLLWCQNATSPSDVRVIIVLKDNVTTRSQLQAWYHGLVLAHRLNRQFSKETESRNQQRVMFEQITSSLEYSRWTFGSHASKLSSAGWDLDIPVLETASGSRIRAI